MANDPLIVNEGDRLAVIAEVVKVKKGKLTVLKIDGYEYAMRPIKNKGRK